jgi:2-oxoglutarate dehydrogenase E2 component (dihydrolipoamide succinyltransferase)
MPTDITVPTLGESVTEATIGRWFKKPGDPVKADEPLVELETDKVTLEVNAPASGTLGEIVAKDGETVGPGAVLGSIVDGGAGAATAPAVKAPEPKPNPSEPKPATAKPADAPQAAPKPAASSANGPAVGRIAAETGLDPANVLGTGKDGRVTKGDMLSALQGAPTGIAAPPPAAAPAPAHLRAPSAPDDAAREERVRMTKLRQTIARRLKDAQNIAAMLTTFNDVDMGAVMKLRSQYKDVFEKKHGVKLGFMGFFTKAVVQALKELPAVNAEIDGQDIVYKNYYHIGIAVGTEKGLVVPVIRTPTSFRSPRSRRRSRPMARRRATASSRSRRCRAAPSRSRTAASTARSCRRRSSTRRNPAFSACIGSRSARSSRRSGGRAADDVPRRVL